MAWQDRHYYRDQGSSSGNPLLWFFTGSVPLFTAFGIRVRMHAAMLLIIVWELVISGTSLGMGTDNALTFGVVLFGIVLLHEFGHCFAARSVGGDANEILMWPLGGLAFANAPKRPWPQTVTVAGGPLVNVLICVVCGVTLALINWQNPYVPWNPLNAQIPRGDFVSFYLLWVFTISWALLLFNLVPIYPLDGGRLLQSLLWFKLGYYRASMIAFVVGMIGSVLMIMYGITQFSTWGGGLLVVIGLWCLWACYTHRAQLKAAGPWEFEDDGVDYSASTWHPDEKRKRRRKFSRRKTRKLRRLAEEEEAEQTRLDAILAKVSAHGMHSLTWLERRALRKATERQKQREMELPRNRV